VEQILFTMNTLNSSTLEGGRDQNDQNKSDGPIQSVSHTQVDLSMIAMHGKNGVNHFMINDPKRS
jgi:hypothetical protein